MSADLQSVAVPARPVSRRKRLLELLFTIIMGAALLALTLRCVDVGLVADSLRKIGLQAALAAGLLALAQVVLCALRWTLITRLTPSPLHFASALLGYLEAAFINAFLPSMIVSDGTRSLRAISSGASPSHAIAGVASDRLVALCALAIASAIGLLLLPDASRHPLVLLALVGLLPGFLLGLVTLDLMRRFLARFRTLWLLRPFLELAALMQQLRRMPALTAAVLAISLLGHAASAGAFYVLSRQLELNIGYWEMFALSAPIIVYSSLPISVGGWGLREALSATLFGLVGVSPASGVALSIAFGLLMSAVGLICGAAALTVALQRRARKLRRVRP